jgi:hypothetical protein
MLGGSTVRGHSYMHLTNSRPPLTGVRGLGNKEYCQRGEVKS